MKHPLVSIITPTFNRPGYLHLVLECVNAQSYKNIEWIILDDSEKPDLNFQVKSIENVKYIHQKKRLSVGEKRNLLVKASAGKYIVQFDDDDFYGEKYIETLMKVMEDKNADFLLMSGFFCSHLNQKILGYYRTRHKKGIAYKFSREGISSVTLEDLNIPMIHLCYGWSYIFKREVWEKNPFKDMSVFEDRTFLIEAVKNKYKVIYYEDQDGIASHSVHNRSSSVCFPQFIMPNFITKKLFKEQSGLAQKFFDI
jgi:glycosyltransferase involved in cell wall biosynthesis